MRIRLPIRLCCNVTQIVQILFEYNLLSYKLNVQVLKHLDISKFKSCFKKSGTSCSAEKGLFFANFHSHGT
jgi:hypothetical protein